MKANAVEASAPAWQNCFLEEIMPLLLGPRRQFLELGHGRHTVMPVKKHARSGQATQLRYDRKRCVRVHTFEHECS